MLEAVEKEKELTQNFHPGYEILVHTSVTKKIF